MMQITWNRDTKRYFLSPSPEMPTTWLKRRLESLADGPKYRIDPLKEYLQPGDELWLYEKPHDGLLNGEVGYVIVRGGVPVIKTVDFYS